MTGPYFDQLIKIRPRLQSLRSTRKRTSAPRPSGLAAAAAEPARGGRYSQARLSGRNRVSGRQDQEGLTSSLGDLGAPGDLCQKWWFTGRSLLGHELARIAHRTVGSPLTGKMRLEASVGPTSATNPESLARVGRSYRR